MYQQNIIIQDLVETVKHLIQEIYKGKYLHIIALYKLLLRASLHNDPNYIVHESLERIELAAINTFKTIYNALFYFTCFIFPFFYVLKHSFGVDFFEGLVYILIVNACFIVFVVFNLLLSEEKKNSIFRSLLRKFPFLIVMIFYKLRKDSSIINKD